MASQTTSPRCRWRKPGTGTLKTNTDGAFSMNSGSGGWEFIIRDENEDITHAGTGSCQHLLDAFHAELFACLHGVSEAMKEGMGRVVLETDSQLVKLALETSFFALAATRGIVFE